MSASSVRGLKTEEDMNDDKFVRFFDIIQDAASKEECVSFSFAGEGHEIITEDLDGENLSGWLIGTDDADEFEE